MSTNGNSRNTSNTAIKGALVAEDSSEDLREDLTEIDGIGPDEADLTELEELSDGVESDTLRADALIPLEPLTSVGTPGRTGPEWTESSFEQWSRELTKRPLLSREGEIELAKRIERSDQEARDEFIESNLKLVVSIAKRYRGCGVPMEDLIQEGNLGLIKAVDRFDYRKGCRFSTCAVVWIEGQIRRSIANLRHNIHLPLRVVAELRKINRVSDHLSQRLGRQPTVEEIARTLDNPVEHIKDLLALPADSVSIDEALDGDMDKFLGDVLEDESVIFPDDALLVENTRSQISHAIQHLPPRQQTVLKMRYGLDGEVEHTLEEIGQKLRLTRQRVWQIESSAIKKIKCLDCPRVLSLAD
ncbi:MAG: RNA polymerase sigma factor RpoD/SigA [Armatimonadetes bacterium]|nr:RNA polymerase sigma factor RpoD/SigA [Armatimonadota bacterium]